MNYHNDVISQCTQIHSPKQYSFLTSGVGYSMGVFTWSWFTLLTLLTLDMVVTGIR